MIPVAHVDPSIIASGFRPGFCWYLHRESLALYLGDPQTGAWVYSVDLERCRTSAEVLDWIFQVSTKTWAPPEVVGELVRALDAALSPQATLCSFGEERGPLDIAALLKQTLPRFKGRYAERLRMNVKPSPSKERGLPHLRPVQTPADTQT